MIFLELSKIFQKKISKKKFLQIFCQKKFQKKIFFRKCFSKFFENCSLNMQKKVNFSKKNDGLPKPPDGIFFHHQNHLEVFIRKGPPTTSLVYIYTFGASS